MSRTLSVSLRILAVLLVLGAWSCRRTIVPEPIEYVEESTGERAVSTTVFLEERARVVFTASGTRPIRLALWKAPEGGEECGVEVAIAGDVVTPDDVATEFVVAGLDASEATRDLVVSFTLERHLVARMASEPTRLTACGRQWSLDDTDRATLVAFSERI